MLTGLKQFLVCIGFFLALQFGVSLSAQAVPAFVRQTGMNCNSCHIGTHDVVPNFTRTGRLFAMRGYQVPYIRERLRAEGDTGNNNEKSKYGGDYLALAIGCGSKPFAWMNDSGFWVITRMSGMTEAEALRTVTPMSAIMGFTGLIVLLAAATLLPLV